MDDIHPHHGSKLRHKVAGLWKSIVRSAARSRYSRLKAEDSRYSSSSFRPGTSACESNDIPNPNPNCSRRSSTRNCFSFRIPYQHGKRRLCRHMSFTKTRKQRLEQVKGKIKGWMQNNGNSKSSKEFPKDVPKGFVAVCVGDKEEERMRFVIPVWYLNHPLFLHLLEEAEAVYGFNQSGVFSIPCQVSDFEYLQWLIEREQNFKP